MPLLSTAIGRVLVAASDADTAREAIGAAPLVAHTPLTLTDRQAVAREVETIALSGHAFVDGEFEAGVAGLAVPIRTQSGTVAGLGLSAPRERFANGEFRREAVECLRECADAVGGLL